MKSLILLSLASLALGGRKLTPLLDDSHPCIAENLKDSHRYICDSDANVICLSGWKEPDEPHRRSLTNPCPIPICDYNNQTCLHGECIRPGVCACEVGWQGHLCDKCICLPGCLHGSCEYAFECNCETDELTGVPRYMGAFCDMPNCPDCNPNNGKCLEPFVCSCLNGWDGPNCEHCLPMAGCVNGDCDNNKPGTCECRPGWQGHLCDEPICSEGCHENNGYCNQPDECICRTGWENNNCTQCIPYWDCPTGGTCIEPNQCICDTAVAAADEEGFCNRVDINGPVYEPYGDCSNPCEQNDLVGAEPGTRTRGIRWCPLEGCSDTTEDCYGTQSWTFVSSGGSDFDKCVFDTSTGNDEIPGPTVAATTEGAVSTGFFVFSSGNPVTSAPTGANSDF